jgi:hypothetical protein
MTRRFAVCLGRRRLPFNGRADCRWNKILPKAVRAGRIAGFPKDQLLSPQDVL